MLQLMIVDDDALMCNQLAALLCWEQLGIEIAAYASDGQEAVQVLKQHDIDLVLTDMDMPKMNGVELIEHINVHYPHIHVIALSAYDDYHYVRGSMKYGAHDYVLKSRLSKETMENLIAEIIKKDRALGDLKDHVSLTYDQLLESFFSRLLKPGDFDRTQIGNIINNLNIKFNRDCLAVMLVDYYAEAEDEMLNRSLFHMCQQILGEADFVQPLKTEKCRFCFILSFKNETSQAQVLKKLEIWGRTLISNGKKFFNVSLKVSISDLCGDIFNLCHYYGQAAEQSSVFFYEENQEFVTPWTYVKKKEHGCGTVSFPDRKECKKMIGEGRIDDLKQFWSHFFEQAGKGKGPIVKLVKGLRKELDWIFLIAEEQGVKKAYLLNGNGRLDEEMGKIRTLTQWETLFQTILERLREALCPDFGCENYHKYTKYILKKIHTQYSEPLSLTDLSGELGVSSAYLSNTFKNDVGTGFNEYLNKLRIEKVIEAIKNGDGKLKDIVERAGFQNYNYFFKVFKEYTGVTPAQYFN